MNILWVVLHLDGTTELEDINSAVAMSVLVAILHKGNEQLIVAWILIPFKSAFLFRLLPTSAYSQCRNSCVPLYLWINFANTQIWVQYANTTRRRNVRYNIVLYSMATRGPRLIAFYLRTAMTRQWFRLCLRTSRIFSN